jgi:hypothetical protein
MKRYLQKLMRTMKLNQREPFGMYTWGVSTTKQSHQPPSVCLRLYCGAGKIDAFAAMLRAAPSARLPVRMHFGNISNANVTASSSIRKEHVLAYDSRAHAHVVCLKYPSVAIIHGADFGSRAR